MTILRRAFTATTLIALASSAAIADSVSFSHTTPSTLATFTDPFTLSNFDTALGTLDSVTITFAYTATASVGIIDTTGVPQPFTGATASIPLTLSGPDGLTPVTFDVTAGPFAGTAVGFGPDVIAGPTDVGTLTIDVPIADFADFENPPNSIPDSYSVLTSDGTYSGSETSGAGGEFFGGSAVAGGVTTVTYVYTAAAPEPATMALMGGALLGLGLLGKRFGKR